MGKHDCLIANNHIQVFEKEVRFQFLCYLADILQWGRGLYAFCKMRKWFDYNWHNHDNAAIFTDYNIAARAIDIVWDMINIIIVSYQLYVYANDLNINL